MSGRPSRKSAEIGLFRPFSAFFLLFRRVRGAPGKSRKRRKRAFFLRYPQICLNPHLLNPHLRHSKSFELGGDFAPQKKLAPPPPQNSPQIRSWPPPPSLLRDPHPPKISLENRQPPPPSWCLGLPLPLPRAEKKNPKRPPSEAECIKIALRHSLAIFTADSGIARNCAMGIGFVTFNCRENRHSQAIFDRKEIAHLGNLKIARFGRGAVKIAAATAVLSADT